MEFACVEGPLPSCSGDHCRGLAWMFRGGPEGLGGDHRTEVPQYRVGIVGGVEFGVPGQGCVWS